MIPRAQEAYQLFHKGIEALARIEHTGICIDTEYCERKKVELAGDIKDLRDHLEKMELGKKWREVYGGKTNLNSNPQLADVLFNHMGYESMKLTAAGNPSVDKETLEEIRDPAVNTILRIRRLQKARTTYINNILRETVDGLLHPFFDLHTARTYRSSSSHPNFQNIPTKIPEIRKIIRTAILPRPGRQLLEIDYSGIEVRVAACYHRDPNMVMYIEDTDKDMHRDMAMEIYTLQQPQVSKTIRYSAKNGFVFPQFYGSATEECAKNLWQNITALNLKTADGGVTLKKHLQSVKMGTYPRFEKYIKKVQERFWKERFPVYTEWKDLWVEEYEKKGYFDTLTGFRCSGLMRRNEAINYPIQGSAFHCLLWSLIEMEKRLNKEKLTSKIVAQIHDSLLFDCVPEELERVLGMAHEVMCEEIRVFWPWLIVPLEIEAEVTPVDGSWFEAKEMGK